MHLLYISRTLEKIGSAIHVYILRIIITKVPFILIFHILN